MEPRIYSYVRFSSMKQKNGSSLQRQEKSIEAYAKEKGLPIDDTLNMKDLGVSGYRGDNSKTGALGEFLRLCEKGKIAKGSILVIEQLDRLSRLPWQEATKIAQTIMKAGVTIKELIDGNEYSDPDDFESAMQLMSSLHQANKFSSKLSKRRKEANTIKRLENKPFTSTCPQWMVMKKDKSTFELISEKADIVKKIVKYALEGYGDKKLCERLNKEKVPTISGSKNWQVSYIQKILTHPALIGEYHPNEIVDGKSVRMKDLVLKDYYPSVITKKEFLSIKANRKRRTHQKGPIGKNVANLFTGILFDARDGFPLQRLVKNIPRLISSSYRNGLSHKELLLTFPYEPFENALLFFLANEVQLSDLYADNQINGIEDKTEALTFELSEIEEKIRIFEGEILNDGDAKSLANALKILHAKKSEKESEIEKERSKHLTNENCGIELCDLKALVSIKNHPSLSDLRTKIKSKIGRLIERIYVVFIGKKRSKFKTAIVQIFFKTGGIKFLVIDTNESSLLNVDCKANTIGKIDLRLYCDETKGIKIREIIAKKEVEFLSILESKAKK